MTLTSPKAPRTRPPPVQDAITLLEGEHASARELLALLLRMTNAGRNRERVVAVLTEDLWIHMQIEEEIFYPAMSRASHGVAEAPVVRPALREALAQLERCAPVGPEILAHAARVLALHDDDSHEEERHVFPHARRALGEEELVALGERMKARRQELRESGGVRREPLRAGRRSASIEP
jgi:hypothetical protein